MSVEAVDLGGVGKIAALLAAIGPVEGKTVIDIGCGEGAVIKALAELGAHATGYDPFMAPVPRTALGKGSYEIRHGGAEALPEPDGVADAVLFVFSLHHVPAAKQGPGLREARRLLKSGGKLCVAEPLAEGPGQYVMEPYHDETAVRRGALEALKTWAAPAFGEETVLYYSEARVFPDWQAYADQAISNMRFNGYTEADVLNPVVKGRFEEMAAEHAGRFDQRVRINLFA